MIIIREEETSLPPSDLLERLASVEHERWSEQALIAVKDMTPERLERWTRLANTPYDRLSEDMRQQDRDQVARYWPIILAYLEEHPI